MMHLVLWLAIRVVVFGIALTYATRTIEGVKVEPRSALPFVALVVALLNSLPYVIIKGAITYLSLGLFFFLAPFVATAAILWVADKYLKPFKIDGVAPLVKASFVMAVAHLVLWFAMRVF